MAMTEEDLFQYDGRSVLDALRQFLLDNDLPVTLMPFIRNAIAKDMPFAQIVAELRQTPEYKAAYPENEIRQQNGFEWWPERQIREYRSEARRLSHLYFGVGASNNEIAGLITKNVDLREWERRLQTHVQVMKYGPAVKAVLEQELGFQITDDRLHAFMSADIPTPELERAYENAINRGRPTVYGFAVRPEEEAEKLRLHGIDPEKAFAGYGQMAAELPRAQRLALIEAQITKNPTRFPPVADALRGVTIGKLFRAIQLRDIDTLTELSGQMSREIARWQAGGGAAQSGTGLVGLLSPEERARQ